MSPSSSRGHSFEAALARVFEHAGANRASWFTLTSGEPLFTAGSPSDTLYLLRSGRLGVYGQGVGGVPELRGVIRPGEPAGEMALVAETPHTATVVALRDSEVLALPRDAFFKAARHDPDLLVELARLMIRRARDRSEGGTHPTVFGFVSARSRPIRAFVERVAAAVVELGFTVQVVDEAALSSAAEWFARLEGAHDFVLYVAEREETAWTSLCLRQVDHLFLIGEGLSTPPVDVTLASPVGLRSPALDLILTRPRGMDRPTNTRVWLDALNPGRWFQVQEGESTDAARIARVLTGTSIGLVLSGGGARAYAHVGAVQVLRAAGVTFDFIGGASMGAVIGAGVALGWDDAEIDLRIREAFVEGSPLSDIAFPMIAMTRGRKVQQLLQATYADQTVEDMLLPFYCVSSNLTRGEIEVHRRGPLKQAIRASISLPGVLPPVVSKGEVLVDGAVIDNFPTKTMRCLHAGPVIGVDLSRIRGVDAHTLERPPSWWKWLASGEWKKGTPLVAVLMRSATITTDAELKVAREETDLLIQPNPEGVDIRDWKAYAQTVESGRAAAREALRDLPAPLTHLRRRSTASQLLEPDERANEMPETDEVTARGVA